MPARIRLRDLTPEERHELERLANSRTAPARFGRAGPDPPPGRRRRRQDRGHRPPNWTSRGLLSPAGSRHGSATAAWPPWTTSPLRTARPPMRRARAGRGSSPRRRGRPGGLGPALWLLDARPSGGVPPRAEGDPDPTEPDRPGAPAESLVWRIKRPGSASRSTPPSPRNGRSSTNSTPTRRPTAPSSASTRWGRRRPRATPAASRSARPREWPGDARAARRSGTAGD